MLGEAGESPCEPERGDGCTSCRRRPDRAGRPQVRQLGAAGRGRRRALPANSGRAGPPNSARADLAAAAPPRPAAKFAPPAGGGGGRRARPGEAPRRAPARAPNGRPGAAPSRRVSRGPSGRPHPPTGRTGPSCGGEARGTHPSRPGVRAGRASALRRALRLSLPVPGAPFRRVSTPAFRSRRPPPGEGLGAAVRLGRGRPPVTRCCVLAELRSGAQAASPGNSEVTSGPAAYPRGQGRGPQVCLEAGGRGVRGHLQVPSYRLLRSSVTESWDW